MQSSRRSTRLAAIAAVAVACTGALAACGQEEGAPDADENVELRVAWWGNEARGEITQAMIDLFEEKNPGITVVGEFSDVSPYWQRISTEAAAGNAPDIIQIDTQNVPQYSDLGLLVDLAEHTEHLDLSGYTDTDLAMGTTDAGLVGIPIGVLSPSILINEAVFDAAGVPIPDDATWSWDDYYATAQAISDQSADGVWGASPFGFSELTLTIWARQHGEDTWTADNEWGISDETLTAFYSKIKECVDSGACTPAQTAVEDAASGTTSTSFTKGNVGMGEAWSHSIPSTLAQMPEGTELSLLRYPGSAANPGSDFYKASMYWSMTTQSQHPEEAAKFLDFMLNDPDAALIQLANRGVPLNSNVREVVGGQLDPGALAGLEYVTAIADSVGDPSPLGPNVAGQLPDVIDRFTTPVLFGESSPQQGAQDLRVEIERLIAQD